MSEPSGTRIRAARHPAQLVATVVGMTALGVLVGRNLPGRGEPRSTSA